MSADHWHDDHWHGHDSHESHGGGWDHGSAGLADTYAWMIKWAIWCILPFFK